MNIAVIAVIALSLTCFTLLLLLGAVSFVGAGYKKKSEELEGVIEELEAELTAAEDAYKDIEKEMVKMVEQFEVAMRERDALRMQKGIN